MRLLIIVLIALLTSVTLTAQNATLTPTLTQQLKNSNSSDYLKVNIVFASQIHYGSVNAQFKAQNTPLNERAKTVIRKSMKIAKSSQASIIDLLKDNSSQVKSYKSLWIINMMTIEATKNIIEQLSMNPEIDYIEEFNHFTVKPAEILQGETSNSKSIGGIEPGLAAINAPALWAMGYTGKGRKYLNYDTGMWTDHPALADAWLGNYQPLSQAWYGVDSPTPIDKDGAHGTHTAGTVLGLDPATNDTIGVAFNAYVMVTDPIVTSAADIKPLPEYIDVFEFALNPDGDTTTTNDIPDAINNSWGIDIHDDTTLCAGYITQMFDAIEAAGIANVYSAGNEGPGSTTIGQPQYVSTGLVNTFTVGAVNGANPTFPITSFSSVGPTICNVPAGPLKIKPEVVAPGLNVRSAVEDNNYAFYNGTSMAGPHATGAVLLLKEAFPNVSGEEILLALYNSAMDLGVVGEDNVYGKGMINVLAAYNLLSLTHTPTPANQYTYDATVSEITNPSSEFICTQSIAPTINIMNQGQSSIVNAEIIYQLNDEPQSSFSWVGTLIPGNTALINLPNINALGYGGYELKVKIIIDTNNIECDYINNQRIQRFNIRETVATLPYSEDFENMDINNSEWLISNADGSTSWDTIPTSGLNGSLVSASMQLFNYNNLDEKDELVSTNISLPNQDSIFLRFDLAYQYFLPIPTLADSLEIFISSDCGNNYTSIYKKGGADLQTHTTSTSNFVPQSPDHWRTEYVDITSFANNDVIVKFISFNRSGNNLYLDNIWIYEGEEPIITSISDIILDEISIYPNPTKSVFKIDLRTNEIKNSSIELYDLLGKSVYKTQITSKTSSINLEDFSNGVYILKFSNSKGVLTKKIIKE
jgi:bacillopeptidase F